MSNVLSRTASSPRSDSGRVLFEIVEDGEKIPCAISREALEDVAQMPCYRPADLLRCFAKARDRIEKLALDKLRTRPSYVSSRLNVWSGDVDKQSGRGAAVNPSLSSRPG